MIAGYARYFIFNIRVVMGFFWFGTSVKVFGIKAVHICAFV